MVAVKRCMRRGALPPAPVMVLTVLLGACGGDARAPERGEPLPPGAWTLDPARSLIAQLGYNLDDPRLDMQLYAPGVEGTCTLTGAGEDTMQQLTYSGQGEVRYGRFGPEALTWVSTCTTEISSNACDMPAPFSRQVSYNAQGLPERVEASYEGVRTFRYDEAGRLIGQESGPSPLEADDETRWLIEYTYAADGKLSRKIIEQRAASGEVLHASIHDYTYTVDDEGITRWETRERRAPLKLNAWDAQGVMTFANEDDSCAGVSFTHAPDRAHPTSIQRSGTCQQNTRDAELVIDADQQLVTSREQQTPTSGALFVRSFWNKQREGGGAGWRFVHEDKEIRADGQEVQLVTYTLERAGAACRSPRFELGANPFAQLNNLWL